MTNLNGKIEVASKPGRWTSECLSFHESGQLQDLSFHKSGGLQDLSFHKSGRLQDLATCLLTIFPRPAWCQVKPYLQCFQRSCGLHCGGASGEQNFTGTNVVFICWDHLLAGSYIDGTTFCLDLILMGSLIVGFLLPVADEHVLANISPIAKIPNPRRKKSQLKKKRSYLLVFWPPVMSKVTLISPSLGRQGQLFIPNLKQKP